MSKYYHLILFSFITSFSFGQTNFAGTWIGIVTQKGKDTGFYYKLELSQDGNAVTGQSTSKLADGDKKGVFEVAGVIEGGVLKLQEVVQLEPIGEKWCMKFLNLRQSSNQDQTWIGGDWTATGCTPGMVRLEKQTPTQSEKDIALIEADYAGNWMGSLNQSDRDYGFYYEMNLEKAAGKGTSYIVAEGNGGSCTHSLTYGVVGDQFSFKEFEIIRKEDPNWKWCIKSGNLTYRKESDKHILEGNWEGYIEDFDMETGACASGQLYLEKPILKQMQADEKQTMSVYEVRQNRKVKVSRILKVKSNQLKVKVWDNGIVDGDILTLFLNGEMIFDKFRVTKTKRTAIVDLKKGDNLLILHADDLGDIKPNTVAVSIDDGHKEHILIVSSNLRESGAVMIKQFRQD